MSSLFSKEQSKGIIKSLAVEKMFSCAKRKPPPKQEAVHQRIQR